MMAMEEADDLNSHGKGRWKRNVGNRWTSWAEVRRVAQDRAGWRENVAALYASWRKEN